MRIVFVSPVSVFGGAERSLLSWINASRTAWPDARPTLVVPGDGPLADRAAAAGVAVERLPMPAALASLGDSGLRGVRVLDRLTASLSGASLAIPGAWRYLSDLGRLLDRLSPDLVHSNGIKSHLTLSLLGVVSRRRLATPVVWHIHDFLGQRPLASQLSAVASSGAALGIPVSRAVADDARAIGLQMPLRVVYNGVDLKEFSPSDVDGDLLDRLAGLEPANGPVVRVVLVATYARWKGHEIFLRAASLARQMTGSVMRFYIVGGPIYATAGSQYSRQELHALARTANVGDVVGYVGFQSHPAPIYRAADIVVHASTRPEPFGLTIVEAMACGRAVVAAQAGGAAELFTNGLDAVGVESGSVEKLADAICRVAESPSLRRHLAQNARRTAMTRFDATDLVPEVLRCYQLALCNSETADRIEPRQGLRGR